MPTVPILKSQKIQENALSSPQASSALPQFVGQPLTSPIEAATKFSDVVGRIALEEKKNADDVVSTKAFAETTELKNKLFWDPKNGAFTRKGQDALGVVDEYSDRFKQGTEEIMSRLNNEDQRRQYEMIRTRVGSDLNNDLQKHLFMESKQFDENTTKYGVKAAQDDAVLNYEDPTKVQSSIQTQHELMKQFALRNGIPEGSDQFNELLKESTSKTYTGVLSRMLDQGRDLDAQAFFRAHKKEMTSDDLIHSDKVLEEGSVRGESQRRSDAIMAQSLSMTSALEEVKGIKDPKVRDATYDRLKNEYAAKEKAMQVDRENRFQNVANIVEQSQGRDEIPLNLWLSLSLSEKNSIDARIKQLHAGIEPATDWQQYYELKNLASGYETKNEFMNLNLLSYRPKLGDPEFKEIVSLQEQMRTKDKGADEYLNGYRSNLMIVNDVMKSIGLNPNARPGSGDAEKSTKFRQMVDENVLSLQNETGKKVTSEDVQKISDKLGTQIILDKGLIWDTKKRAYEIKDTDLDIQNVPTEDRSKIEEALKINNLPVTEKSILNLYIRKLQRSR